MFDKKNKVSPESQSQVLDPEFQAAQDELIKLIQQQENASFFRRQFVIPIRNFFHSMFPTVGWFKSSLALALEKFVALREKQPVVVRDSNEPKKSQGISFSSLLPSSKSQNNDSQSNVETPDKQIGEAFQVYIQGNGTINQNIKDALKQYIAHQKQFSLSTVSESTNESRGLWRKVRSAIQSHKGAEVILDDVMSKIKTLYPAAIADDKQYEYEEEIKNTIKAKTSTATMHAQGLKPTGSNHDSAFCGDKNSYRFGSLFSSNPPSAQEKLDEAATELQERIKNLNNKNDDSSCWYIANIEDLQPRLISLLELKLGSNEGDNAQAIREESLRVDVFIKRAKISLVAADDRQWDTHLKKSLLAGAKTKLTQLYEDIKALDCSLVNVNEDENTYNL